MANEVSVRLTLVNDRVVCRAKVWPRDLVDALEGVGVVPRAAAGAGDAPAEEMAIYAEPVEYLIDYASEPDARAVAEEWWQKEDPAAIRGAFLDACQHDAPITTSFRSFIRALVDFVRDGLPLDDVFVLVVNDRLGLIPWECLPEYEAEPRCVVCRDRPPLPSISGPDWRGPDSAGVWLGCVGSPGHPCLAVDGFDLTAYMQWAAGGAVAPSLPADYQLHDPGGNQTFTTVSLYRAADSPQSIDQALREAGCHSIMIGAAGAASDGRLRIAQGGLMEEVAPGDLADSAPIGQPRLAALFPLRHPHAVPGHWPLLGGTAARLGARLGVTSLITLRARTAAHAGRAAGRSVRYGQMQGLRDQIREALRAMHKMDVDYRQIVFSGNASNLQEAPRIMDEVDLKLRAQAAVDHVAHLAGGLDLRDCSAIGDWVTADCLVAEQIRRLAAKLVNEGPGEAPFNIMVLGDSGAGKSFLVKQFAAALGEVPVEVEALTTDPEHTHGLAKRFIQKVQAQVPEVIGFLDEVHVRCTDPNELEAFVFSRLLKFMRGEQYEIDGVPAVLPPVPLFYGSSWAATPAEFLHKCTSDPQGSSGPDFCSKFNTPDQWLALPSVRRSMGERILRFCAIAHRKFRQSALDSLKIEAVVLVLAGVCDFHSTRDIEGMVDYAVGRNGGRGETLRFDHVFMHDPLTALVQAGALMHCLAAYPELYAQQVTVTRTAGAPPTTAVSP